MEEKSNRFFDNIGGRKMALTILAIVVGTIIETVTERGLSTSFAGLLAGLVAAYSATNMMITNSAMKMSGGNVADKDDGYILESLNNVQSQIDQLTKNADQVLEKQAADIEATKATVVNLGKVVTAMRQA